MIRPLAISLSPNTEQEDVLKAFSLLVRPWTYTSGKSVYRLEEWFRNYFKIEYTASFNSGRSALYAILSAMGIGEGDEVLMQAFTCIAVSNAILWLGAKPVYVDTVDNLTMDPKDLEKKITKKTKAIIVQHTFGIPTDMDAIMHITRLKKIPIIEDCAHVIGGTYKGKKLGTMGDAALFSFGRDKAFSSVFGGMAITNDEELGKKIKKIQQQVSYPSLAWTAQQLFHPVAFFFILLFYTSGFGKILLIVFQKLKFLSFPVTPGEKKANKSELFIRRMPNALCTLALQQLKKLEKYNKKREAIAEEYITSIQGSKPSTKKLPYLRFPIYVDNRDQVLKDFKKKNIYLGKWYSEIIDPKGVELKKVGYEKGSCPNAEEAAETIINLPTYPLMTKDDAATIVQLINSYGIAKRD